MQLLASARRRRRATWLGGALFAAAAVVTVIAVLPGSPKPAPELIRPGAVTAEPKEVRLTAAMRRAITATLRRFLPAAVRRRNPALAWELAGPGLRAGTTRAEWLRGDLPVYPYAYDTRKRLDGWVPMYTYSGRVGFDLLLHPGRPDSGGLVVAVEMVRRERRWAVQYWNATATLSPPKAKRQYVMGAPDYAAGGSTAKGYYEGKVSGEAALQPVWLLVPIGLLGSGLVALVARALVARALVTRRRERRAVAARAR